MRLLTRAHLHLVSPAHRLGPLVKARVSVNFFGKKDLQPLGIQRVFVARRLQSTWWRIHRGRRPSLVWAVVSRKPQGLIQAIQHSRCSAGISETKMRRDAAAGIAVSRGYLVRLAVNQQSRWAVSREWPRLIRLVFRPSGSSYLGWNDLRCSGPFFQKT